MGGVWSPQTENFTQTRNIHAPHGHSAFFKRLVLLIQHCISCLHYITYPLGDYHEIYRICGRLHDRLGVKIWMDSLKGLLSYRGLHLGDAFPPNYQSQEEMFWSCKKTLYFHCSKNMEKSIPPRQISPQSVQG